MSSVPVGNTRSATFSFHCSALTEIDTLSTEARSTVNRNSLGADVADKLERRDTPSLRIATTLCRTCRLNVTVAFELPDALGGTAMYMGRHCSGDTSIDSACDFISPAAFTRIAASCAVAFGRVQPPSVASVG